MFVTLKAVGIVVEYNPFHNGHFYHLQQSKEKANADVVIAVMSGYFLQRGEPALVSKWARTKMALKNGVDLVVELPYAFSTQSAEIFARGAVAILDSLFCHSLCFGSEQGKIEPFYKALERIKQNKNEYENCLKEALNEGYSYPKAKSIAFLSLINNNEDIVDLSKPNNILGIQYIQAIHDLKSSITPLTTKRIGGGYHDQRLHESTIASATSIRNTIFSKKELHTLHSYMPKSSYEELIYYKKTFSNFHQWEDYFPFLKHAILTKSINELSEIYEMEEGLEYRFKEKIKNAKSFLDFVQSVKTKRYTWTRLQRICVHLLTNTKKDEMLHALTIKSAPYIRLLGMNKRGQSYLNFIKKEVEVPLIAKLSSYDSPFLELDIKAANVYSLVFPEPISTDFMHLEFSTPPLRYNEENKSFIN